MKGNKYYSMELLFSFLYQDLGINLIRSFIHIYIYIYIYSHPQTDCFVVLQFFSVARHTSCSKLGLKPTQLYIRLMTYPWTKPAIQHQLGN